MLWLLVPSLGCAPMGPPDPFVDDDQPSLDGNVFVDPAVLDFGVFDLPDQPGDQQFLEATFDVYNAGAEATVLHGQNEVIGSDAFHVQTGNRETLEAHAVVEYTVVFQPLVDDGYEGEISLKYGDATVELRGVAHAPRLAVDAVVDITTPYRCEHTHALRVENIGHDPLWLNPNDFSKEGPQYGVSWADDSELWLDPGQVAELGIVFEPIAVGDVPPIEARIQTNEPGDPIRTIEIDATGGAEEPARDSFRFDTDLQTSLVIVPDTRDAMSDTREAIASAASSLVNALQAESGAKDFNDVNVAVVGGFSDAPCPTTARAFYNTRTDLDVASAIAEGITAVGASTGNLLDLAQGAVYEMGPSGCLHDFLRPTTALHVVILSNGSEDSYSSPTTYAASIANEVTALGGFGVTISVFVPGGEDCTGEGCARLVEATEYLNGSVWDLSTDDWNATLGAYGTSLVPLHAYLPLILSQRVLGGDSDAIQIFVDGGDVPLDAAWYWYNAGPQAVMLDMAAPITAGSIVDVAYVPSASCD